MPKRLLPLLLALAALAIGIGCKSDKSRSNPEAEANELASYGSELSKPLSEGSPSGGTIVVRLIDQNGEHPEGVPVVVSGPVSLGLISDSEGRVEVTGPPGKYNFEVKAGCSDRVLVMSGSSGTAVLAAGSKGEGSLKIAWKHRIAPGYGAYPSQSPDWYLAQTIDVYFDVLDRCANDKAPGALFPTWKFRTSPNIDLVGTPQTVSDHKAQALVRVRCNNPGDARLNAFDSRNRGDEFDLIRYMLLQGTIRCSERSR